ncbi:MAG: hypothetical protein K0R72_699 [Clostridia bacterium]|jgi:hypothetical protein|nr:hypothetical protein [Clostridia bacterium]
MKQGSTLFLRISIFFIAIPVITLCILGLPWLANNPVNPDYAYMLYPICIGMYLSVIPFFIALYQSFKLLNYIDNNQGFSELSVKALNNIKICAIIISALYVTIMPFVYLLADLDDAPGLIIIGIVPAFASMVISVFTAVLQKLFRNAIDIKSENDLTI